MKVAVTYAQHRALTNIYGPPENVYNLIWDARNNDTRYFLEGDSDDFDDLLCVISEEVGESLCSKADAKALLQVCKKVDPTSLDWIGM